MVMVFPFYKPSRGGATTLGAPTDVSNTTQDGQVLKYDATNSIWAPPRLNRAVAVVVE